MRGDVSGDILSSTASSEMSWVLKSPGLLPPPRSAAVEDPQKSSFTAAPIVFTPTPRKAKAARANPFVSAQTELCALSSSIDAFAKEFLYSLRPLQPLFDQPTRREPLVEPPIIPREAMPAPRSSDEGDTSASTQWQLVRGVLDEMMHSFRSEVNSQIQNLHLEMLRQFQFQQMELAVLFDKMSVKKEMLDEIARLRDENERLRNMY